MNEKVRDIAERIKGLRLLTGWAEEEAARKIGLPVQEYLKYEKGEDDIPISILYEIADCYQVDLTDVLTGVSPKLHDVCFIKKGKGLKVERYDQYDFQSLAYQYVNRKIEPLLVTLDAENSPELVSHHGQEFNFCLEGKMKVIIGSMEYVLDPGDSLYFNSLIPHKMLALEKRPAKFLTVILL
ncbi:MULTISPECIES: XRE family transcriptional regulator [unclassified Dehalobacter]|uniref:helix-turn-helix domain-containing protein n=1 Tax=unclassified Dehalobacter TaxID=2635733 RepID=UPI000E6BF683|nr:MULTISPECIES: XRE family transcriptional regulator [unclassified Dehalobacter]RJE47962.1 transcriptional regulator [Dehalobacter sp. MCB1]TCX50630.1 transcriptional regulator [Dehalobacter sp. 14DCB1]TCX52126.1 transcriptional regulator [Dehalobacter sp. 12DCB1]